MAPDPELMRRLELFPAEVAAALADLAARLRERPAAGGFSPVEHVWHLADLEREAFGERIVRLRSGGSPHLPDFDGGRAARERDYQARDAAEGLRRFREARLTNLRQLREVTPAEWSHAGTQEHVGPVTLAELPQRMHEHDEAHRRELGELLATQPGLAHGRA